MTTVLERRIRSTGAHLQALFLPDPDLTITITTPPEQVRERIAAAQEHDRSRLGYHSSATESEFVVERAHAEIDRRLATRRGRKHGVTDKQMRSAASGVLMRTAGLVERSKVVVPIACALGIAAALVYLVLLAFGVAGGLWDLERMPTADVAKLDILSKRAALTAVVSAVVLAMLCGALGVARPPTGARPRGTAPILVRAAGTLVSVFSSAGFGLSLYYLGVATAFTAM